MISTKDLAKDKKLRMLHYHGSETFVKLFSGDVSYFIEILEKMCAFSRKDEGPISRNIQSSVIRNYSRTLINLLRDIKTRYVPSLYDVAYYFGLMSKRQLFEKGMDFLRVDIEIDELEDAIDGIWFKGQGQWAKLENKQINQFQDYIEYLYKLKQQDKLRMNQCGISTAQEIIWLKQAQKLIDCGV